MKAHRQDKSGLRPFVRRATGRAVFLFAALASPAHAQEIFMEQFNSANQAATSIAGTTAVNAAIGRSARNAYALSRGAPAPASEPSSNFGMVVAASAAGVGAAVNHAFSAPALDYRASPVVTAQTYRRFIDNLVRNSRDPGHAFDTRRKLETRDMIGEFRARMALYGLRTNNLADVTTGYWIANWSIANQSALPTPGQVRAAQSQLGAALLRDARIARADEETRQRLSETLIYQTMFALSTRERLVGASNLAGMRKLADIIDRAVLAQSGVDLRRVQLGGDGLALR